MEGKENYPPIIDSNCTLMELNSETKIGLTFGQILSFVAVIGGFVLGYASLEQKIADNKNSIIQLDNNYRQIVSNNEINRRENREDHIKLIEKIDEIIRLQKNK